MIRMVRKLSENKLCIPNLISEKSMAFIKGYRFKNIRDIEYGIGDELIEQWEMVYEIEYKYSMITTRQFDGDHRRKENIINILEMAGKPIIINLAKTLELTFKKWLRAHAITKPRDWAMARMYNDSGDSLIEMEDYEYAFDVVYGELKRYSGASEEQAITDTLQHMDTKELKYFFDSWINDEREMMFSELEDIDEFNERYEKDFETIDEAQDWIENTFSSYDRDYINYMGGEKEARNNIIDMAIESEIFIKLLPGGIDGEEFLLTMLEYVVFPAWYGYWKAQGIDSTRKKVEKITKDIEKIKSLPINKQFMLLNIAKNTNHQNGSMMEYYEEDWDVDYVALERLTKMDTREWDVELKEIGVLL